MIIFCSFLSCSSDHWIIIHRRYYYYFFHFSTRPVRSSDLSQRPLNPRKRKNGGTSLRKFPWQDPASARWCQRTLLLYASRWFAGRYETGSCYTHSPDYIDFIFNLQKRSFWQLIDWTNNKQYRLNNDRSNGSLVVFKVVVFQTEHQA